MPSVLVLGTGIIGYEVAIAFRNAGYKVYATTRAQSKANQLAKDEVIPILVENVQDESKWIQIANRADVIVEALADYNDHTTATKVLESLTKVVNHRGSQQVTLIYTSGVWLYGQAHGELSTLIDENTAQNPLPIPMITSRIAKQQAYLELGATIIQPSIVYGRTGSLTADYFDQVLKGDGKITFPGKEEGWSPYVHTIDLAQLYVLAAGKRAVSRGQVFIGSVYNERRADVIKAIGVANNTPIKSIEFIKPPNPFAECLALSQRFTNQKAKTILDWAPTQPSIVDDADRYLRAYQLSK